MKAKIINLFSLAKSLYGAYLLWKHKETEQPQCEGEDCEENNSGVSL